MRQLHHSLQVSISPLAGEPGFPIALTSEGGSIWYLRSDSRGTIVARLDDRGLIAEQYRIRARAQTFLVERKRIVLDTCCSALTVIKRPGGDTRLIYLGTPPRDDRCFQAGSTQMLSDARGKVWLTQPFLGLLSFDALGGNSIRQTGICTTQLMLGPGNKIWFLYGVEPKSLCRVDESLRPACMAGITLKKDIAIAYCPVEKAFWIALYLDSELMRISSTGTVKRFQLDEHPSNIACAKGQGAWYIAGPLPETFRGAMQTGKVTAAGIVTRRSGGGDNLVVDGSGTPWLLSYANQVILRLKF
jgi:hypothetical protein